MTTAVIIRDTTFASSQKSSRLTLLNAPAYGDSSELEKEGVEEADALDAASSRDKRHI